MVGSNRSSATPAFWLTWFLAFLGFPMGGLAAQAVTGGVQTPFEGLTGGAAAGLVIGAVQWLVLRTPLRLSSLWVPATGLGMGVGLAVAVAVFGTDTRSGLLLVRGLIVGLGVGFAQGILLRHNAQHMGLWIMTTPIAWTIGWAVTHAAGINLSPDFAVFGSTGAWAFQFVTGLALRDLVRPQADRAAD